MALRIVFAGTPDVAVPALRVAGARGELVAVYTQPDRPAGRGRQVGITPVKAEALAHGWPVRQPENFKSAEAREALRALQPDLLVVAAYGLILPASVLSIPRLGGWNLHASLLPRWRGAAPIQRAIEAGDAQTGVCLMQMEKGLDTGPVLLSLSIPIAADETGGSLHGRLSRLAAEVLEDGLKLLRAGMRPMPQPQPTDGVTYAHKLEKSEARLDWSQPGDVLERRVRAFDPWPMCEAMVSGELLRVHAARYLPLKHRHPAGTVLMATRTGIDIACGQGALRLLRVQRAGGRPIAVADYLNARSALRTV
jgi:methionyl-tRNA formyltransferase